MIGLHTFSLENMLEMLLKEAIATNVVVVDVAEASLELFNDESKHLSSL